MGHIHLIGGEKGGVGKSVLARVLAQFMIDHDIPFTGFDTDRSHGSLLRFYAGYASPALIDEYQSLDVIVEAALADPGQRILVDLAAQSHQPFAKWLEDSGVLELADELNMHLTYWNVMDSGQDCVHLLDRLLGQYGTRLNYILVQNQLRDDNFTLSDASGVKGRALALKAKVITLKRLHPPTMGKIDSNSASFWVAKNKGADTPNGLGLLERQRLKIWLKHAYGQIRMVGL